MERTIQLMFAPAVLSGPQARDVALAERLRAAAAGDQRAFDQLYAMQATRDVMLREAGGRLEDLLSDYEFVRLADLTSLTFCTGWTGEQRFGNWTVRLSGTRVLTPDVFGGAEIPVEIAAQALRQTRFSSDSQLREAIRDSQITMLRGTVLGG